MHEDISDKGKCRISGWEVVFLHPLIRVPIVRSYKYTITYPEGPDPVLVTDAPELPSQHWAQAIQRCSLAIDANPNNAKAQGGLQVRALQRLYCEVRPKST